MVTGPLRVRGIEGEDVQVTVTYRIRRGGSSLSGEGSGERPGGHRSWPNSLEIETPERRLATGLAWLFGGARVSAEIAVEVPWGSKGPFETMTGSVEGD